MQTGWSIYDTSTVVTRRLQNGTQVAASRLVVGSLVGLGKYEYITPVLRDVLHWLPVPQRIQSF